MNGRADAQITKPELIAIATTGTKAAIGIRIPNPQEPPVTSTALNVVSGARIALRIRHRLAASVT